MELLARIPGKNPDTPLPETLAKIACPGHGPTSSGPRWQICGLKMA